MDALAKACFFAVAGVVCLLVLRQWKGDFLPLVRVGLCVGFALLTLAAAAPLADFLRELGGVSGVSTYVTVLLKALGLAVLTQCCADICRECGEGGVAGGVELVGKLEILLLSLPLIREILEAAGELLTLGG